MTQAPHLPHKCLKSFEAARDKGQKARRVSASAPLCLRARRLILCLSGKRRARCPNGQAPHSSAAQRGASI